MDVPELLRTDDAGASAPLSMKSIDPAMRPREKSKNLGFDHLSDAELMAILVATGIRGKNVVDLCQEIIDDAGGISKVTSMSIAGLSKYKGIGEVKAITLLAAMHLGVRAAKDAVSRTDPVINTADLAYDAMRHHFYRLRHEEFWILLIDRAGHIIRDVRISQGGTAATVVDVKIIMRHAVESLASSMVLFHNHPSGTLRPSAEDDALTRKIVEAGKVLDVRVFDHIIVTDASYFSYADNGRM